MVVIEMVWIGLNFLLPAVYVITKLQKKIVHRDVVPVKGNETSQFSELKKKTTLKFRYSGKIKEALNQNDDTSLLLPSWYFWNSELRKFIKSINLSGRIVRKILKW